MKKLLLLVLTFPAVARDYALRVTSEQRLQDQLGRQQLNMVLVYPGKDREHRRVIEDFRRAARDSDVADVVSFLYADADRYDFTNMMTHFNIQALPAYLLFRNAYDEKNKRYELQLASTQTGHGLSQQGIVNFVLDNFGNEMATIRKEQLRQARLRAKQAEAKQRERAARYPFGYWGPYWGGYFGPYYYGYWGAPYYGPYWGGVGFGVGF
jgi:hypothetical protein